jgi:hypothetical protein
MPRPGTRLPAKFIGVWFGLLMVLTVQHTYDE